MWSGNTCCRCWFSWHWGSSLWCLKKTFQNFCHVWLYKRCSRLAFNEAVKCGIRGHIEADIVPSHSSHMAVHYLFHSRLSRIWSDTIFDHVLIIFTGWPLNALPKCDLIIFTIDMSVVTKCCVEVPSYFSCPFAIFSSRWVFQRIWSWSSRGSWFRCCWLRGCWFLSGRFRGCWNVN